MRVRFRVLGGFAVEVDGCPVDVASLPRRTGELVELLALTPERRRLRDEVIEALFGHLDAEAGVANLHKAASVARTRLGHRDAVVLDGGSVILWPASTPVRVASPASASRRWRQIFDPTTAEG